MVVNWVLYEEFGKPQPKEREVNLDVVIPGQRGIETIRRRLREIRSRETVTIERQFAHSLLSSRLPGSKL